MMLRAMLLACFYPILSQDCASAQTCPVTTGDFSESADLQVRHAATSCVVPDGGFIRMATTYSLDVDANVTGWCHTYIYNNGQCQASTLYNRTAIGSALKMNGASAGLVSGNSNVQNYNTCGNGNCTPVNTLSNGPAWSSSTRGSYTYTAISNTGGGTSGNGSQYCNMGINYSENHPVTVNVVGCNPVWYEPGNYNVVAHVPATSLSLYVPSAMWNKLASTSNSPAQKAAAEWTSALSGVGISVSVVNSSCGTGADCIEVTTGSVDQGACANYVHGTPDLQAGAGTGVDQSPGLMTLPTGYGSIDDYRLQRTIAHELGHAFGLNHFVSDTFCTKNTSVMAPVSDCTSPTGLTATPSLNDTLPTTSSTYGNHEQTSCGF